VELEGIDGAQTAISWERRYFKFRSFPIIVPRVIWSQIVEDCLQRSFRNMPLACRR